MHEGRQPVLCRRGRTPHAQMLVVTCAHDELLTPVAEQVGGHARNRFGAVIGLAAVCIEDLLHFAGRDHLGDSRAAEHLALHVAVPVDEEVHGKAQTCELVAVFVQDCLGRSCAPKLCAGVSGKNVVGTASSRVLVAVFVEDDLPVCGIKECDTEGRTVLMTLPQLQTGTFRDKIPKVLRIAVTFSGAPEERSVIINDAVAHADLLPAVAVHIAGHEVMISLPGGTLRALVIGIKYPADGEFLIHHIDRRDRQARVIASAIDCAWMHAVQIRDAAVEAIHTVAVAIAPGIDIAAGDRKRNRIERRTSLTVEQRHILRAVEDIAAGIAVVFRSVADDLARAVLRAISSLGDEFCLAVKVKVCHAHLRIMLPCADVDPHVHAPQGLSSKRHAVDIDLVGVAGLRVVERLALPLEEDLILSVAVHIADTAVVRRVLCAGTVQRNIEVICSRTEPALLRGENLSTGETVHTILRIGRATAVLIACRVARLARIDQVAVAVELKCSIVRIIGIEAPAHKHAVSGFHGIDTPVKVFHDVVPRAVLGCCRNALHCHTRQHGASHDQCCNHRTDTSFLFHLNSSFG